MDDQSGWRRDRGNAVARYLPAGTLDAAFGADGRRTGLAQPGLSHEGVRPDPRRTVVVLVGVHVVRVLADGSLDPAFGDGDEIMKYRRLVVWLSDVAVQPDGDLAFGGTPSARNNSNASS